MSRASLRRVVLVSFACFGAVAPSACRHHRRQAPIARGGGPVSTGDLDDGSIAGIAGSVHTALIEQAEVAQDRGDDDAVKLFADRVLARQTQLGQWANVEYARMRVEPRETAQSRAIADESMATMRSLSSKMGDEFDLAYVESQVRLLERAVQLYDGTLTRDVDDAGVRTVLNRDRDALHAQLTEARGLMARLQTRAVSPTRLSAP
jgi:predicted outer membrane protein